MKRAGPDTIKLLEPLLREVRLLPGLTENKPGIFYRKRDAFLHFHEDEAGLFADLKVRGDYVRLRVSTIAERKAFLIAVKKAVVS
jgi:hypothetical protein